MHKRLLAMLVVLVLFGAFVSCGKAETPQTPPEAQGAQQGGESPAEGAAAGAEASGFTYAETPVLVPSDHLSFAFTSSYAIGLLSFFAVTHEAGSGETATPKLSRVAMDTFLLAETIALPDTYQGVPLTDIIISGITDHWLLVSRRMEEERSGDAPFRYVLFRVSLETLEAEPLCTSDWGIPWYHWGYVLLLRQQEDCLQVEALDHDSGERTVIFDQKGYLAAKWVYHWHNCEDNMVLLEEVQDDDHAHSNYLLIDKEFHAQPIAYDSENMSALWQRSTAQQVVCGDTTYTVEYDDAAQQSNLYRAKTDGSNRELLREQTNIYQLLEEDGKLFCLAHNPTVEDENARQVGFYALDEYGKVSAVLAHGWEGEDNGFYLKPFGKMILMLEDTVYGASSLCALYDPQWDEIFPDNR